MVKEKARPCHEKTFSFAYAKAKEQISCPVTAQLADLHLCFCYIGTFLLQGYLWLPYNLVDCVCLR